MKPDSPHQEKLGKAFHPLEFKSGNKNFSPLQREQNRIKEDFFFGFSVFGEANKVPLLCAKHNKKCIKSHDEPRRLSCRLGLDTQMSASDNGMLITLAIVTKP